MIRTKKHVYAFPLLCSLLLVAGCGQQAEEPSTQTDKKLEGVIPVPAGTKFQIALDANPTTGYTWTYETPLDEEILKQVDREYKQKPESQGKMGAGGTEVFVFEALKPGKTTISLVYKKMWETDEPVGKTYVAHVEVRPAHANNQQPETTQPATQK